MPRLLIVEDQLGLREVLTAAFEDDFEVKTATCGIEALEIIAIWHPDVMITDCAMPGMTGMDLIREINKTDVGAHHAAPRPNNKIKIILYSACLTDEIKLEARAMGVAACLEKPFDLVELRRLIRDP